MKTEMATIGAVRAAFQPHSSIFEPLITLAVAGAKEKGWVDWNLALARASEMAAMCADAVTTGGA